MKPLTLLLMTKRGYRLLADTIEAFGALFEQVIIGRDQSLDNDYSQKIADLCDQHGIKWTARQSAMTVSTEYAVAVGWRWMIAFPEDKLIVFHDSLLPRYRGFNPLVTCLINGDKQVGVTAILGAKQYDSGPVLAQSSVDLTYPCTIEKAIDEISACYRATACEVFGMLQGGQQLTGRAQDESLVSYSLWRDEADYRINWNNSAARLARFIDAVGSPYSGAITLVNGLPARVGKSVPLPDVVIENRCVGKVIWLDAGLPVVVCGEGLLRIDELTDIATNASLLPLTRFRSRFS